MAILVTGVAQAQAVRILGRSEPAKPSGFVIQWPMSGFEARFSGRSFTAVIEDTGKNWLDVEIDGKASALALKPGKQSYVLFSSSAAAHTIRVTRRTGAMEGATRILLLKADKLAPIPAPKRRILVIGDSIAAGYGVEGENQWCTFTPATQNAGKAWPALLARRMGADLQVIAVDGRGLYRNYSGDGPTMATLMSRTLPDGPVWKGMFAPQLVVVNLGTNDFGSGDPGPQFDAAYEQLLADLRKAYPEAQLVAAIGGMLEPDKLALLKRSIEDVVGKIRAAGDLRTSFVFLDPPATGRRYGCDWHPGIDAQISMAQTLQAKAAPLLGWTPAGGK